MGVGVGVGIGIGVRLEWRWRHALASTNWRECRTAAATSKKLASPSQENLELSSLDGGEAAGVRLPGRRRRRGPVCKQLRVLRDRGNKEAVHAVLPRPPQRRRQRRRSGEDAGLARVAREQGAREVSGRLRRPSN